MEEIDTKQDRVIFYRKGSNYFYKYKEDILPVNLMVIDLLREKLSLPYQIDFYGCSMTIIGKIIGDFYDKGVEVKLEKVGIRPNHSLHYKATFTERKNVIDVIKIPYISDIYGRKNDPNPYKIIDNNGKKILLEVTKDYAKKNEGDYYLLWNDLTKGEKEAFSIFHKSLEYDLMYNIIDNRPSISKEDVSKEFIDIDSLKTYLFNSWEKETCLSSFRSNWTIDDLSLSQSDITSLVVNDYYGGKIMRCMTSSGIHYYNTIDDEVIDLTKEQFHGEKIQYDNGEEITREYLLSNEDTKSRYLLLKNNIDKAFKKEKNLSKVLN